MDIGETVKIVVDELGKLRVFKGKVISINENFVVIQDRYIGKLEINLANIIKVEEWNDE